MCRRCGGIVGDPYESPTITGAGFDIQFYGGSALRWSYQYCFSYQTQRANWLLVREKQERYHKLDIDKRTKERTIEAEELSGITIDNFYSVPHFTRQKWKLVAAKIFFYNAPKLSGKTRKALFGKRRCGDGVPGVYQFCAGTLQQPKRTVIYRLCFKKAARKNRLTANT